jgi:hypothetical protein
VNEIIEFYPGHPNKSLQNFPIAEVVELFTHPDLPSQGLFWGPSACQEGLGRLNGRNLSGLASSSLTVQPF